MSVSRANGERCDTSRGEFNPWHEIERVFDAAYPTRHKWFTVFYLRRTMGWSWRKISKGVSLHHGHCSRVFRRAAADVAALEQKILQGVAHLRIAQLPDDDE